MSGACAGFVDVGYLQRTGMGKLNLRSSVNLDAAAVVKWLRGEATETLSDHTFLRAYWYDGEYDPSHSNYRDQRRLFNAIARTPGLQLRLGHISEHPNRFEKPLFGCSPSNGIRPTPGSGAIVAGVQSAVDF